MQQLLGPKQSQHILKTQLRVEQGGLEISENRFSPGLQRQPSEGGSPSVRSPALEEAVTQVTTVEAAVETETGARGRSLTALERDQAEEVFGSSIDYSRVRLIPTQILPRRTVGNTIRVAENFSVDKPADAIILIHELTHVWQYQHGGTGYISESIASRIGQGKWAGKEYTIMPRSSFFDFATEQQAYIVEHYFTMLRDQSAPRPPTQGNYYLSNHLDASGNLVFLSWEERQNEVTRELPDHDRLIQQMRRALPRPEVDILRSRAEEVIRMPHAERLPAREEHRVFPVKPVFEVRW